MDLAHMNTDDDSISNSFYTVQNVKIVNGENRSILPNFLNDLNNKLIKPELDDESENGPLDFSVHRVQDMLFTPLPAGTEINVNDHQNKLVHAERSRLKLTERETAEQRQRRLIKGRERMKNLRANETVEQRKMRLIKARECQRRRRERERSTETDEEKETRLKKARERTRLRREQETEEQRDRRLQVTRDRIRDKRHLESPEERHKRLVTQRVRKKERYQQLTPDECAGLVGKIKSDLLNRKKLKSFHKKNSFEDDLDEALLKFENGNNDTEDSSWLAEPEVCLSVDSLENDTSDEQHDVKISVQNLSTATTKSKNLLPLRHTETSSIMKSKNFILQPIKSEIQQNHIHNSIAQSQSSQLSKKAILLASNNLSHVQSSHVINGDLCSNSQSPIMPQPEDVEEQLNQHISTVAMSLIIPQKQPPPYSSILSGYMEKHEYKTEFSNSERTPQNYATVLQYEAMPEKHTNSTYDSLTYDTTLNRSQSALDSMTNYERALDRHKSCEQISVFDKSSDFDTNSDCNKANESYSSNSNISPDETFNSFHCNKIESDFLRVTSAASLSNSSHPAASAFNSYIDNRILNQYSYCTSADYSPQTNSSSDTILNNGIYHSQVVQSNSYHVDAADNFQETQSEEAINQGSFSDHDSPLDLQHQTLFNR